MSGFVPEKDRLDFVETVFQADHDSRTTGVFLLLIAPRSDGQAREAVLTVGALPTEPILDRALRQGIAALQRHNQEVRHA